MIDLRLQWRERPELRVMQRAGATEVIVDPGLSVHQVAAACQALGDLGWQILGRWCALMQPHVGTASAVTCDGPSMIALLTRDRVIRWVSDEVQATLGWHSEELVGRPVTDLGHPAQATVIAQGRAQVDRGRPATGVIQVRCASGAFRRTRASVTPFIGPSGGSTFLLGQWCFGTSAQEELSAHTLRAAG